MGARRPPAPGSAELAASDTELDALYANASCLNSTRCCQLRRYGHVPLVFEVEGRRAIAGVMRRGGRLPLEGEIGDCPLLLRSGACSVYADRPFGCRTFYCADATLPDGPRRAEVQALAMQLRALAERLGDSDLRPLTNVLDDAFDDDGKAKFSKARRRTT